MNYLYYLAGEIAFFAIRGKVGKKDAVRSMSF